MKGNAAMTTETVAEKQKSASLAVLLPPELKDLLQQDAETSETSAMAIVRGMIAERYGFTLQPSQRGGAARKKYATPEEREAAQVAQAKTRRDKLSSLMDLFESGNLVMADGTAVNLEELVAQRQAQQEAAKAQAAADAAAKAAEAANAPA